MNEHMASWKFDGSSARSAVTPCRSPIGQHHVRDVRRTRAEPLGFDGRSPNHAPTAIVGVVRACQEVEPLTPELEPRRELMWRHGSDFRRPKLIDVASQLDDNRNSLRPTAMQFGERFTGSAQYGVVDGDAGSPNPGRGRARGRVNHDTPPEARSSSAIGDSGQGPIMPEW
jgi:hypothetical protein